MRKLFREWKNTLEAKGKDPQLSKNQVYQDLYVQLPKDIDFKVQEFEQEFKKDPEPYWSHVKDLVSQIKEYRRTNKQLYEQNQELERIVYRKNYGVSTFVPAKLTMQNKEYYYRQRYVHPYVNAISDPYLSELQN